MTAEPSVAAIRSTVALRKFPAATLHLHCGSQLRSRKLVDQLKEFESTEDMGGVNAGITS